MIFIPQKVGRYVKCENCGKEIYITPYRECRNKHHFCSQQCSAQWRTKNKSAICEVCGKVFVKKYKTQRFCSNECQHIWQKGNIGVKNPKFEGKILKCEYCGKEFALGKYKANQSRHHFCSKECRQKWYSEVWSQSDEWKKESQERALSMLENGAFKNKSKPQRIYDELLEKEGIKFINEKVFGKYAFDNYFPESGLVVEVMGDYWHASPSKYNFQNMNDVQKNSVRKDKAKHTYMARYHDVEILYLWENDLYKEPQKCIELTKRYIKNNGKLENYNSFNYKIDENNMITLIDEIVLSNSEIKSDAS